MTILSRPFPSHASVVCAKCLGKNSGTLTFRLLFADGWNTAIDVGVDDDDDESDSGTNACRLFCGTNSGTSVFSLLFFTICDAIRGKHVGNYAFFE